MGIEPTSEAWERKQFCQLDSPLPERDVTGLMLIAAQTSRSSPVPGSRARRRA